LIAEPLSLSRSIRAPQATALVVGVVVGVAIFVQPAEVARLVGSPAALLGVWLAAGLLALAGALVCAELASGARGGGGVLAYLTDAFGPAVGFLWAWALFWIIHTAIVGAIAVVFARSLGALVPTLDFDRRLLAVVAILALTWLNVTGVRHGAAVQSALTVFKVGALLALAGAALVLGRAATATAPDAAALATSAALAPGDWSAALIAALFTFGGWHLVTFPTDETKAPERTLPRALILGLAAVLAIYLVLNVAYLAVLPFDQLAGSSHVAADAAFALAGPSGRTAIALVATLSALGALAGVVLAGPRALHALAASGRAPARLAAVHARYRTPHLALVVQALWASALVAFDSYRTLYSRALAVEWLFFALLGIAAIRLRRRGAPRRFSMPFYPLLPILFSTVSLALVVDRLRADPAGAGVGLLCVGLGLPVYFVWRKRELAAPALGAPLPEERP
jgi:APA family basic amino acid/polyamine antiporter